MTIGEKFNINGFSEFGVFLYHGQRTHHTLKEMFYYHNTINTNMGPTTLLGAAHAPLNHCFILRIFLKSF